MLNKIIQIANHKNRGVFLTATPMGKDLYLKRGFEVVEEVEVCLEEYN